METKELTQSVQHKAFKRTFLQDVTAEVTFAETNLLGNGGAFQTFLKNHFGISDNIELPKLGAINISSEHKEERYCLSTTNATVTIDASVYRYYKESLKPRLKVLESFLMVLGISEVKSFSICKRNHFPGTSNNAYAIWKKALKETFKEPAIQSLADTPNLSEKPFKLSIEGRTETEWGEVKVPFSVEVPDKDNLNFQLDLTATAVSVDVDDLLSMGAEMNDSIFEAFINVVSDKLLYLLQKEE